jgi:3-dehydroquinate synthase
MTALGKSHGLPVEKITVPLGARSYDIVIGANLLERAGDWIAPKLARPKTIIVTESTVAGAQLGRLTTGLAANGIEFETLILEPGEGTKSFAGLERLCSDLLAANLERSDTVIALGGGVIGDLTGFAASILRRGMNFIQIPTTLLAQVDSSVGGKTAINTKEGKNLVGAFHQPSLVLVDVTCLETLRERDFKSGYAEVVKYGLINDPEFFTWLTGKSTDLMEGDTGVRTEAVLRSCQAKANIVAQDEKEQGVRALLNLGHTFAHALEAETGYSDRLTHGEAVSIGMTLAHEFSEFLGLCPPEDVGRVIAHLRSTGLKTTLQDIPGKPCGVKSLIKHMYQDKKVQDTKLTFILTRGIGQAFVARDVDVSKLQAFLTSKA